jgi:hypothetical protein
VTGETIQMARLTPPMACRRRSRPQRREGSAPGCSRPCAPATTTLSPGGITTNRHRDWHQGNHLAKRLHDKASQV